MGEVDDNEPCDERDDAQHDPQTIDLGGGSLSRMHDRSEESEQFVVLIGDKRCYAHEQHTRPPSGSSW